MASKIDYGSIHRGSRSEERKSSRERSVTVLMTVYVAAAIAGQSFGYIGIGSLARLLAVPLIVVTAVGYRRKLVPHTNFVFVLLVIIAVLALCSYFWTMNSSQTLSTTETFFELSAVSGAMVLAIQRTGRHGFRSIANGLMIGSLTSSLLIFQKELTHSLVNASHYGFVDERVSSGLSDPNNMALCLAITMPVLLVDKRWKIRLLILPIGSALLLTGSRGGILAAGGSILVVVAQFLRAFLRSPARRNLINLLQIICVIGIATVVGLSFLPSQLSTRFKTIPSELFSGGTLSLRTILWRTAWSGILHSPFTGYGAGTASTYEDVHVGLAYVVHNIYLSFLLQLGICGFLLFVGALLFSFAGAIKVNRIAPWLLPTLVGLCIGISSLSWDTSKVLWIVLVASGSALAERKYILRSDISDVSAADKEFSPRKLMRPTPRLRN